MAGQIDQQDPAALSLAGMLYLRTAIAAAERQDRSTTTTLIAAADRAASQLGRDADYWQTSFGPTNVQLHRVATSIDLGDVPWVIEHGSRIDASHLPAERSVAHQIDLARAYSYVARDDDALAQLLAAEAVAPQIVRHSARVRDTVKSLHRRARHNAGSSSPLLDLAMRCRAIQ